MAVSQKRCKLIAEAIIRGVKEHNVAMVIPGVDLPYLQRKDMNNILDLMSASENKEGRIYMVFPIFTAKNSLDEPPEENEVSVVLIGTNPMAMWRGWKEFYEIFKMNEEELPEKARLPPEYHTMMAGEHKRIKDGLEEYYRVKLRD